MPQLCISCCRACSNECGEAFAAWLPVGGVPFSYAVAISYVLVRRMQANDACRPYSLAGRAAGAWQPTRDTSDRVCEQSLWPHPRQNCGTWDAGRCHASLLSCVAVYKRGRATGCAVHGGRWILTTSLRERGSRRGRSLTPAI